MELIGIMLLVGLIVLANKVQQQEAETFHKLFDLLMIGLNVPLFIVGVLLVFQFNELRAIVDIPLDSPTAVGIFLQATAVWGVAVSFRSTRHSVERFLPIDPHSPLHTLALVLSGYFAGSAILQLQVSGGLENLAENLPPASIWLFIVQSLGFVFISLLGVGMLMRRDWTAVWQRLGLEPINSRQVIILLGWIVVLIILQAMGGIAWEAIDPDKVAQVEAIGLQLYQDFGFWHWLALALAAGIGEEILFRGALQPIFGNWFTSILFAIVHVQYGFLTPATLVLFLLSFILGRIRQKYSTTAAILVHVGYDFALGMISLLVVAA